MGGAVRFQTSNALAAAAACRALGVSRRDVAAALGTFHGNEHNQGRMNLYKVRNGFVLVGCATQVDVMRHDAAVVRRHPNLHGTLQTRAPRQMFDRRDEPEVVENAWMHGVRQRAHLTERLTRDVVHRREALRVSRGRRLLDGRAIGITQPGCRLGDDLEHLLGIGRR